MPKYDVTKLNVGIEKCLEVTTNARHRFLLQAYYRHRFLEVAGRYEEIFAPEMMEARTVLKTQSIPSRKRTPTVTTTTELTNT
jgi:hypothetical protein